MMHLTYKKHFGSFYDVYRQTFIEEEQ